MEWPFKRQSQHGSLNRYRVGKVSAVKIGWHKWRVTEQTGYGADDIETIFRGPDKALMNYVDLLAQATALAEQERERRKRHARVIQRQHLEGRHSGPFDKCLRCAPRRRNP